MANTDIQNDENLTPSEVSVRLKVSVKTLAAWRSVGKGPRFFYANPDDQSSPRYPVGEIVAIEKNLRDHT